MIAADVQALLVNPLFWIALAVGILVVEVLVVSGASLAVGLAGLLVGIGLMMFPAAAPTSAEVARMVTVAAAVWSLASLLAVLALRLWFRRQKMLSDPNDYPAEVGVERGSEEKTVVQEESYKDVLRDYKPRLD